MFRANKITVFLPGDGETQVFEKVKFQSNPEVGVLAVMEMILVELPISLI